MITITASMVKKLREITGVGVMSCKEALQVANGNMEDAIQELRKSGAVISDKLIGRNTNEGIVAIVVNGVCKKGFMAEINCQTDFVAHSREFIEFSQKIVNCGLKEETMNVSDTLSSVHWETSKTLEQIRKELIFKVRENIQVRRVKLLSAGDGIIGHYTHRNRIGVLVALNSKNLSLARNIAIHIAAFNPKVIRSSDVSNEIVFKEKEILMAQAKRDGKSEDIINRIVDGRLNKLLKEMSLEGQNFVKDPEILVGDLLRSERSTVLSFVRFEIGDMVASSRKIVQ
ncbi:translation elongation factor Ts [Coxiella endosymbiont of Amblyomma sculptum]|uniref:translation elongation factor Ts n=1 Tax=Coxiella endosymbiont of Amblyomma sculptum TaxID=2487929 RepID=UPI00132EC1F0|nr:translation elongation factor Ts [Coxiella endosymbiont of Amblyomma sculptum]QHG92334.1 translation elongation factor Ts [Coxiella endosymbiont of Amblyomma sculptum]